MDYPRSSRDEGGVPYHIVDAESFGHKTTKDWLKQVKGRGDECLFNMALDWTSSSPAEAKGLLMDFVPMENVFQQGKWVGFLKMREEFG